ncbi:MAG: ornithine carbamoyltransferase [Candidatus Levybacteria bacterium]|nr:ornithine carbamoyltransferase [Candidatus Levybacteria bacterium]
MKKDFLSIADLSTKAIWEIFAVAKKLKKELKAKGVHEPLLKGKSLALIFEKQSLRTRISFEIGMAQLGGNTVYLDPRDTGIGVREEDKDVAKVIGSMADIIAIRNHNHALLVLYAKYADIPVINALSDIEHPCQALTDLFTIWEVKNKLQGLKIAYVGDGDNNVAHSLCIGSVMFGATFACASPKGFWMNQGIVDKVKALQRIFNNWQRPRQKVKWLKNECSSITETINPKEAVKNADVVVTDTWVSMGDTDKEERVKIFQEYQVNSALMKLAKKDAIFMHCLPAYRGKEVTPEVIDGQQSVVFQEAENRLHVQKALLLFLLKGKLL